ncbi:uncharacterized protein LOC127463492 isoform X7 [Manacus candei]|uniref:uncharacterized protein LOC127463492 isoform X3 n=1 Tax=Manacus candei TaxID=415023 RepID=UPI0022268DD6|nr:uncharacterized protein LOC127463492 isoform X3 [Manacus candei]XP_051628961.1 uncharacterized protein LOC127463492 isoform X4 [Manacus candei]XP_051628964.1 uncharacterized protein LOC127463492 isoform X7 [Manacus candei]
MLGRGGAAILGQGREGGRCRRRHSPLCGSTEGGPTVPIVTRLPSGAAAALCSDASGSGTRSREPVVELPLCPCAELRLQGLSGLVGSVAWCHFPA